jgi:hypothetical protein
MPGFTQLDEATLDCAAAPDTLDLSTILPAASGLDLVVFIVENRGTGDAVLTVGTDTDSALTIPAGATRETPPYQYGAVSDTIPTLRGALGADLHISAMMWT